MTKVLLHSCCAPCSAAIVEWMLENDYEPTIFFFNPNIFPEEEYLKRKNEIIQYAEREQIPIVDIDDNDTWDGRHQAWLWEARPFANEPERGKRCSVCFDHRLCATAAYAAEHDFPLFTTTLASSRWKDFKQICTSGQFAEEHCGKGRTKFWDKNWRKGGLYERRNILSKQFYNPQYCGCEYSLAQRKLQDERKKISAEVSPQTEI